MVSVDYETPSASNRSTDLALIAILIAGLILRVVVNFTASPFNPDDHFAVIAYIVEHHALPASNVLGHSFHPPLYYVLMAPVLAATYSVKVLHTFSCSFSAINLILIYALVARRVDLFPNRMMRLLVLSFASFLPQFVMYGSFISNDTLTILIGTLVFWQAVRFTDAPTIKNVVLLGAVVGLTLLTKGTMLLFGVALMPVVWKLARTKALVIFCAVWLVIGCYKYVENTINFGHPIVHNLDQDRDWSKAQQGVWKGPRTLIDVNVIKLAQHPILDPNHTLSYPLLMYGTFWYPHIPDSSFRANVRGYHGVGSILYLVATVPTLVFLIGLGRALLSKSIVRRAALILFLAAFIVVIGAGVKYDVWSCFQSRLLFGAFTPMLLLFAAGYEVAQRRVWTRWAVDVTSWLTIAMCIVYFVVEIGVTYNVFTAGPEQLP